MIEGYTPQELAQSEADPQPQRMSDIFFIQCFICLREAPALLDMDDKPDIQPSWRGMSPSCCPNYEVYVCGPRCAMRCGVFVAGRV